MHSRTYSLAFFSKSTPESSTQFARNFKALTSNDADNQTRLYTISFELNRIAQVYANIAIYFGRNSLEQKIYELLELQSQLLSISYDQLPGWQKSQYVLMQTKILQTIIFSYAQLIEELGPNPEWLAKRSFHLDQMATWSYLLINQHYNQVVNLTSLLDHFKSALQIFIQPRFAHSIEADSKENFAAYLEDYLANFLAEFVATHWKGKNYNQYLTMTLNTLSELQENLPKLNSQLAFIKFACVLIARSNQPSRLAFNLYGIVKHEIQSLQTSYLPLILLRKKLIGNANYTLQDLADVYLQLVIRHMQNSKEKEQRVLVLQSCKGLANFTDNHELSAKLATIINGTALINKVFAYQWIIKNYHAGSRDKLTYAIRTFLEANFSSTKLSNLLEIVHENISRKDKNRLVSQESNKKIAQQMLAVLLDRPSLLQESVVNQHSRIAKGI